MTWFAVRTIYLFGTTEDNQNVYEERIVSIEANNFEEAHSKGREEAEEYCDGNGFDMHPEQLVYKQDGSSLIDNYELWSNLYQSSLNISDFYQEHYEKYLYTPEV
jgi:hypothetical protein